MKEKLNIDKQIDYMKNTKNIRFAENEEENAKYFLKNSTYFYKLKSYAKLFDINKNTGEYWELYYKQLVEISKIDLYLRRILFNMCLSIEHQLKLNLINDITNDCDEDGYSIVKIFFREYPNAHEAFSKKSTKSYCSDIYNKYYDDIPIWALVELLSFKELIDLHEMYYSKKATKLGKSYTSKIENFSWSVRIIRNACAHNNCILNSLKNDNIELNFQLLSEIYKLKQNVNGKPDSSDKQKFQKKLLKHDVINDILATIILFNKITTSTKIKENALLDIKNLFERRMIKEKDLFNIKKSDHKFIINSVKFVKEIIDLLYTQQYNTNEDQK